MAKKRQPISVPKAVADKVKRPRRVKPRPPDGLNDRQVRFVQEYCVDLNATRAAIRAGYAKSGAAVEGHRLLTHPKIAAAIADWRQRQAAATLMTADEIKLEMQKLAKANIGDFFYIDPSGQPHIDLTGATRDQLAALNELTVDDYVDGRGEDARDVKRTRIRLESKRQALMDLAKLKGDVVEKVEQKVQIAHDELIEEATRVGDPALVKAAADELEASIEKMRATLRKGSGS